MSNSPYFSVIIPTYNREALLRQALASVWAQTFTDYEVIVVDDGSTDETLASLASFAGRVMVLKQDNKGPGAARNLGIRHAQGERIAFLDSDDVWFPWTLAVHHEACMSFKGASPAMTAGKNILVGAGEPLPQIDGSEMRFAGHGCFFDALDGETLPIGGTPSITLSRDVLVGAGGFCEQRLNGEDTDLWLRLGSEPGFVEILQPPVFAQTVHENSITQDCEMAVAGMNYLFEQHRTTRYAGTPDQGKKIIAVLAATARSASFHALRCGRRKAALQIYIRSLAWNFQLGRLKYVMLFPFVAILGPGKESAQVV